MITLLPFVLTRHLFCNIVVLNLQALKWDEMWDQTYVNNIAGELCLLSGLVMWSTTFPSIRRRMFEVFYYTHNLYILFIIFYILHKGLFFICIMLPGMYLFVIDRFLRFLQSRQKVRLVSARVLPCETVELNFSKSRGKWSFSPFSYRYVCQILWLNVYTQ